MKFWLLAALLSVALASTGQILLKTGVRAATLPPDALRHPLLLIGALANPFVILGTLAFASSMLLWLAAISGQQLSSVYPLAALGYILVTLLSVRFFNDTLTLGKVSGIILIIVGVLVLNSGSSTADTVQSTQIGRAR